MPEIDPLNIAIDFHRAGRRADAEPIYRQILADAPDHAHANYLLGFLLHEINRRNEALPLLRRAVELRPQSFEYRFDLGKVLAAAGKPRDAIDAYRGALSLWPDSADVYNRLGNALQETGEYDQAIDAYRRAIALRPGLLDAHNNLGNALQSRLRFDEAIAAYETALRLTPDQADALNNLGCAHKETDGWPEAVACFRRALALRPDYADAHWNLATALLTIGQLREGWPHYQWREHFATTTPVRFDFPRWRGEPLSGRRILLHAEQGFGDAIQFARFAKLVADRGGEVWLQCQQPLQRLIQSLGSSISVARDGQFVPPMDLHCPLLSLPMIFDIGLEDLPATSAPYLHADASDIARWQAKLVDDHSKMKVGLVWAGRAEHVNDRNRSLSLDRFAPLGTIPGVSFYSLQVGPAADQVRTPPAGLSPRNFADQLTDFADTAALIANLDLVITVDSAVAHLAGALGKRVWVLVPVPSDFRWLRERTDSPWYPTMRLFRQTTRGDWTDPLQAIHRELSMIVE